MGEEEYTERIRPRVFSHAAGRDAKPMRGPDRSRSRSRKATRRSGRSRSRERDDDRRRGRSRSRSRDMRGKRRKGGRRHGRHRRRDYSHSCSDSEETGWERKFLAAAMENAAKARLGVVPLGGSRGGLGMPGGSATAGMNKPVGRFFDNQGRFINPEGGFNPSGAPRRIPWSTRSGVIGSARRVEDTTENIVRRASRAPY